MTVPLPTTDDLARDLVQDLVLLQSGHQPLSAARLWEKIAVAACRRAIAAEAELLRFRDEIASAKNMIRGLVDRVATQSDLLSKRVEVEDAP